MKVTPFIFLAVFLLQACSTTAKVEDAYVPELAGSATQAVVIVPMAAAPGWVLCSGALCDPAVTPKVRVTTAAAPELQEEEGANDNEYKTVVSQYTLVSAHFASGQSKILKRAALDLDEIAIGLKDLLDAGKQINVEVVGYTDGTGGQEINAKLAQERAEAVSGYLRAALAPSILSTYAKGEPLCCYVATNETSEGRAANRRVDVVVRMR